MKSIRKVSYHKKSAEGKGTSTARLHRETKLRTGALNGQSMAQALHPKFSQLGFGQLWEMNSLDVIHLESFSVLRHSNGIQPITDVIARPLQHWLVFVKDNTICSVEDNYYNILLVVLADYDSAFERHLDIILNFNLL